MKAKTRIRTLLLAALLGAGSAALARGTYQEPEAFVLEAFAGHAPAAQTLWITDAMQPTIAQILGHAFAPRRVRYWQEGARSAWVLEEIGKEEPITTGIVVQAGRIENVKVLVYREGRGEEVRYPRFTEQFRGAALTPAQDLDRRIDGISGATLSVRALTRLTRLALYFDAQSRTAR